MKCWHIRPLLGLLISLTLLSVLVYDNRFFSEVFATAATEELDSGEEEGEEEEDPEDEDPGDEESSEGSGGLGGDEAESEEIGADSSDRLGGDGSTPEDLTDPIDEDSGGGGSDEIIGERFRHNAEEIAMELSSLSPEEIKEYPITDLSDKDITLVFRFLDPFNLAKVLLNIPQENLVEIQGRLTPADFNEHLSKLSEVDRKQVVDRIVLTSIN